MIKTKMHRYSEYLLYLLIFFPLLVNYAVMPFVEAEARQYGTLQAIIMGMYNIPALIISGLSFTVGKYSMKEGLVDKANFYFLLSAIVSLLSISFIIAWATGILS